ncbi:hypothetical protein [Bradyrhizobium sp. Ai1a-2]|uniref:hypothetical protein n=1 Tax=Bradyrhizobium sp. Ai1a-2 TaxID=196490 RepID=UPI000429B33B|nr:hypothetical protein [Bradyrhizobium sp. Ai1a-2]
MNFEEKLDEIVRGFLRDEGLDAIISALEVKLMTLRVQEREVIRALLTGPTRKIKPPD